MGTPPLYHERFVKALYMCLDDLLVLISHHTVVKDLCMLWGFVSFKGLTFRLIGEIKCFINAD